MWVAKRPVRGGLRRRRPRGRFRGLRRFGRGSPSERGTSGHSLPRARLVPLPVAALALAGCGSKQDALDAHSKAARGITSLWWNMLIGSALALRSLRSMLLARLGAPPPPGRSRRPRRRPRRVGSSSSASASSSRSLVLSALFLFSEHLPDPRHDASRRHRLPPPTGRSSRSASSATSSGGRCATPARAP